MEVTDRPVLDAIEVIDEGTYGTVYRAQTPTGAQIVVKHNTIEKNGDDLFMNSIRELDALVRFQNHPLFVKLLFPIYGSPFTNTKTGTGHQEDKIHFAFEQANYNLGTLIKQQTQSMHPANLINIVAQTFAAVHHLHAKGWVHRDIKPGNFLCYEDTSGSLRVKLCDFGMTRPDTADPVLRIDTTSWYRAPEMMLGWKCQDSKVDVWSMGCLLFELIARKPFFPISVEDNQTLWQKLLDSHPEPPTSLELRDMVSRQPIKLTVDIATRVVSTDWISLLGVDVSYISNFSRYSGVRFNDLIDLLRNMLRIDPQRRFTMKQCMAHSVFQSDYLVKRLTPIKESFPPVPDEDPMVFPYTGDEYSWIYKVCKTIYNEDQRCNREILFLAVDLFERYIRELVHSREPLSRSKTSHMSRQNAVRYFYNCYHLSIKYFNTIGIPLTYTKITPPEFHSESELKLAEQIQLEICKNICHWKLWRPNIYTVRTEAHSDTELWYLLWYHLRSPLPSPMTVRQAYRYRANQIGTTSSTGAK